MGLFKEGLPAEVLYYFWVKVLECPACGKNVDLFSSYVFSQHAYPGRNPASRALCPECGAINTIDYDADKAKCAESRGASLQTSGRAGTTPDRSLPGMSWFLPDRQDRESHQAPPRHRLYAKMVLLHNGEKQYARISPDDVALYEEAQRQLLESGNAFPWFDQPGLQHEPECWVIIIRTGI